jgi:hypothetical protein
MTRPSEKQVAKLAAIKQRMHDLERAEQAKRFRYLLSDAGLKVDQAAALLHVHPSTVTRWTTGTRAIPYSVFKCIRLMRYMELPGEQWAGWTFHSGVLWSPEGFSLRPLEVSWWGLMVRKARLFQSMYVRQSEMDGLAHRLKMPASKTAESTLTATSAQGGGL